MITKTYTKYPVGIDRLLQEIQNSAVTIALDIPGTSTLGDQLTVTFKADLSDWSIVDTIVSNHSGLPLADTFIQNVSVKSIPDPAPFAAPTYRTKLSAIADLVSCEPDAVADIDFKLLAERYVSGGDLIVENAELGDYITAQVEDIDGIIPSPYRASLCEAWPIVGQYIEKQFVKVRTPGTIEAGSITIHSIETYPLNAKITAGLYLCVEYYAVSTGLTRRIGVNYHNTKKL